MDYVPLISMRGAVVKLHSANMLHKWSMCKAAAAKLCLTVMHNNMAASQNYLTKKIESFIKRLHEDNLYDRLPKTNKKLRTSLNCSLILCQPLAVQHRGKTLVGSFGRTCDLPSQPRIWPSQIKACMNHQIYDIGLNDLMQSQQRCIKVDPSEIKLYYKKKITLFSCYLATHISPLLESGWRDCYELHDVWLMQD